MKTRGRNTFAMAWFLVFLSLHATGAQETQRAKGLIGYTEYRTNLEGGRYANEITMRACVVGADGTGRRELAPELSRKPNTWTQFAGWSPDGAQAIIGSGWESPENGAWEEENKTFRMTEGWLYDMYLLDLGSNVLRNVTEIERVSDYNTGLFFVPGKDRKLGFQALIKGISHPFIMDLDGRNKKDISEGSEGFTYGFSASPDGARVAYHKEYKVYIADADGANARLVDTGLPFNFAPQWSPDGQWLMFVAGEHYNCHPHIVGRDGAGLRKIADRGGYKGTMTVYDVYDFHEGSSDLPVWAPDSAGIFFTAQVGQSVELMHATLAGEIKQLTHSTPGVLHYHPAVSRDGQWVAFGSNRTGTRQLYVMPACGGGEYPITNVEPGTGAMWAQWQPTPVSAKQEEGKRND